MNQIYHTRNSETKHSTDPSPPSDRNDKDRTLAPNQFSWSDIALSRKKTSAQAAPFMDREPSKTDQFQFSNPPPLIIYLLLCVSQLPHTLLDLIDNGHSSWPSVLYSDSDSSFPFTFTFTFTFTFHTVLCLEPKSFLFHSQPESPPTLHQSFDTNPSPSPASRQTPACWISNLIAIETKSHEVTTSIMRR